MEHFGVWEGVLCQAGNNRPSKTDQESFEVESNPPPPPPPPTTKPLHLHLSVQLFSYCNGRRSNNQTTQLLLPQRLSLQEALRSSLVGLPSQPYPFSHLLPRTRTSLSPSLLLLINIRCMYVHAHGNVN